MRPRHVVRPVGGASASCPLHRGLAPLLLTWSALAASPAAAQALQSDVYVRNASGVPTVVSTIGFVPARLAPVTFDSAWDGGTQTSGHSGLAAALTNTLRAETMLGASHPGSSGSYSAKTEVSFSKQVQVGAGLSGLPVGAPVTLTALVRLDGGSEVGGTVAGGGRHLSTGDLALDYRIQDLDDLVCDEGCRPRTLFSFGYDARIGYDSAYDQWLRSAWTSGGTLVAGSPTVNGIDFYSDSVSPAGHLADTVDTGWLVFRYDTFIGHTLEVDGRLDVFMQTYVSNGSSFANGRFHRTFDVDLGSLVAGVELGNELAGVTPAVPEPPVVVLMALGLAALLRRRSGTQSPAGTWIEWITPSSRTS